MSSPAPEMPVLSPGWDRAFRLLPIVLLALGMAVGLGTQGLVDDAPSAYATLLGVGALTAAWVLAWTWGPLRDAGPVGLEIYFWVRTVLGFVLTWLNPFLCFFAFIGYVDADLVRGRRAFLAITIVVATMAGAQSGGLPPQSNGQAVVFVVLLLFNGAIVAVLSHFHLSLVATNDARGAQLTELARLNRELTDAMVRNDELAAQVTAAARQAGVQAERQRLAQEIHDTVAQGLAGILTQLRAAHESRERAEHHMALAERLAEQTLTDARRSVQALSPAALEDRTLHEAIDALVTAWAAEHPARATFAVLGGTDTLHPEIEATLMRITEEALTNVARHADADRVGVTLTYAEGDVLLDVRDDGHGFDLGAPRPATSFGLRGMRQRAERVAGRLDVESEPGSGTAVSARLPAVGNEAGRQFQAALSHD